MINLEIIGGKLTGPHHLGLNRIRRLSEELENLNVNVKFNELPPDYKPIRLKIIKRIHLQNAFYRHIIKNFKNKSFENTIFLASSPPTIYAPTLKPLSKKASTILDLRDIYQEWDYHPFLKRRIEKWEQISTMKKVKAITYVHEGFQSYFKKDNVDLKKTHFITNGASNRIFNSKGDRRHLSDARINLIYAGGIEFYHNVPQWLEIMKELKKRRVDVQLTIIGQGSDSQAVEDKIKKDHLSNVTFLKKQIPQEDLACYIREADYAVATTNVRIKTFHDVVIMTKVYEALCCGTPILSNAGTAMDKFNEKFQFCRNWDPNLGFDTRKISQEIEKLPILSNKDRENMAQKAQSDYSFKSIAEKFKRVLESVL